VLRRGLISFGSEFYQLEVDDMNTVHESFGNMHITYRPDESSPQCEVERVRSMEQLLESDWSELVIQFDAASGQHVVRTACCPMAPGCRSEAAETFAYG